MASNNPPPLKVPQTGNPQLDAYLRELSRAFYFLWDRTGGTSAGIVPVEQGGTGQDSLADVKAAFGYGSMAEQDADSVNIDGGTVDGATINNSPIGGTTANTGAFTTLSASGFTTLGDHAIKVKKLTGTTGASEGGDVSIAHGLDAAKIIGLSVLVNGAGNRFPPEYQKNAENQYSAFFDGTSVYVRLSATNSANIVNSAIIVFLVYEE